MRAATTMRPVAALAALLLAGASTGAHAQFSGDPGSSAGDTPPSAPAAEAGGAAERGDRHRPRRQLDVSLSPAVGQGLTAALKHGGDVPTFQPVSAAHHCRIVPPPPNHAPPCRLRPHLVCAAHPAR